MKLEPVKHYYKTHIEWTEEKKGILKSEEKPDIDVACPPEFGGHPNIWYPEDLFVGATEVCLMTTFIWYMTNEKIPFISYKSNAKGILELGNFNSRFSYIEIKINVCISSKNDVLKVKNIFEKLKQTCVISNSIQTQVIIEPEINIC